MSKYTDQHNMLLDCIMAKLSTHYMPDSKVWQRVRHALDHKLSNVELDSLWAMVHTSARNDKEV